MCSSIIKKTRQDEQQNQTPTTNINYIRKIMTIFFKKRKVIRKSR